MKKITYLILLISTFSFISCNRYKGNNMKAPEYGIVTDTIILKGIEIPLDTILFRYAYRMRVQGNKAVIMDLHNTDYYYHVFSYPDFTYISSFGKRGEGPTEMIYAANIRFVEDNAVWVLDDGKGRMYKYSDISVNDTPKLVKDLLLDRKLYRSLDFDIEDTTVVIPDYSGENRFSWASLSTGKIIRKTERIPISESNQFKDNMSAIAQGWNSFISLSPDKQKLVTVTQFGDRIDIYDLSSHKHIGKLGMHGEPKFYVTPEGYGLPDDKICYYDVQVTDKFIYAIYDGRSFRDISKLANSYKQGGKILRVFNFKGELISNYILDRRIVWFYVDEKTGLLFGLDVNADEQIVKYII